MRQPRRDAERELVGTGDDVRCEQQTLRDGLELGGLPVLGAVAYRTGKYDAINWPGFPDEGYRFYFDEQRRSHLTIRPSGTSNALRFHVQLFGGHPPRNDLIGKKAKLRATTVQIVNDIRKLIGAKR